MHKDYFGEELSIGDCIVLIKPAIHDFTGDKNFTVGWITGFTKELVKIWYRRWDSCWYTAEGWHKRAELLSHQLIKITKEQAVTAGEGAREWLESQ